MNKLIMLLGIFLSFSTFAVESVTLNNRNTLHMNETFKSSSVAKVTQKAIELSLKLDKGDPILHRNRTPQSFFEKKSK